MEAIKELLFKMADDALIIGHRNSEWTGIGPTLEEDIAFSSMAQDKIGHAYNLYTIIHEYFAELEQDTIAFNRPEHMAWRNCQLNEIYSKNYEFCLLRHFLFDMAESIRYQALQKSSVTPLAEFAAKIKGEIKYHTMHAITWIKKLGTANADSVTRMQEALDLVYPMALAIFEPSEHEDFLIENEIFVGEEVIKAEWKAQIQEILDQTQLHLPQVKDEQSFYGARQGKHTEDLNKLLKEMGEVFVIDPSAEW